MLRASVLFGLLFAELKKITNDKTKGIKNDAINIICSICIQM